MTVLQMCVRGKIRVGQLLKAKKDMVVNGALRLRKGRPYRVIDVDPAEELTLKGEGGIPCCLEVSAKNRTDQYWSSLTTLPKR